MKLSNNTNNELVKQVDKLTNMIIDLQSKVEKSKDVKLLEAKIQNRDECYAALLDWTMNNIGKEPTFDVNVMKDYWVNQIK